MHLRLNLICCHTLIYISLYVTCDVFLHYTKIKLLSIYKGEIYLQTLLDKERFLIFYVEKILKYLKWTFKEIMSTNLFVDGQVPELRKKKRG